MFYIVCVLKKSSKRSINKILKKTKKPTGSWRLVRLFPSSALTSPSFSLSYDFVMTRYLYHGNYLPPNLIDYHHYRRHRPCNKVYSEVPHPIGCDDHCQACKRENPHRQQKANTKLLSQIQKSSRHRCLLLLLPLQAN